MEKTKKIKIVFAINDFLVGGAQRQLTRQLRLYDRNKFAISLITLFDFPEQKTLYHLIPKDIAVYRLRFNDFLDWREWIKLYHLFRKINPDIVVSSLFFANTVTRILKWFNRYQVIAREHNTYFDKNWIKILIDRFLSLVSWRIVAVSETVKKFTVSQEKINPEKIVVITNGIDLEEIDTGVARTGLDSASWRPEELQGKKILLNVGRLVTQKNQSGLISAFKLFTAKHQDYALIILGEGGLFAKLADQIVAEELTERVFLWGIVDNPIPYYLEAYFLVSMSTMEGLSNVYLEALACGLPVIATKTAGTDELIKDGENGFFIEKTDPSSVATLLDKIVSNVNLDKLKANARLSVKSYDIRNTVRLYEQLFIKCYIEK